MGLLVFMISIRKIRIVSKYPRYRPQAIRFILQADHLRYYRDIDFEIDKEVYAIKNDLMDIYKQLLYCNLGTKYEDKTRAWLLQILLYGRCLK